MSRDGLLAALLLAVTGAGALLYACGSGGVTSSPVPPQAPVTQPHATATPSGSPTVPIVCTQQIVYGVVIAVRDPEGDPVRDAELVLTDGPYSETMQLEDPEQDPNADGVYLGAAERPGAYELTISAPGFHTQVIRQVTVAPGVCHVSTFGREVTLQPDGDPSNGDDPPKSPGY